MFMPHVKEIEKNLGNIFEKELAKGKEQPCNRVGKQAGKSRYHKKHLRRLYYL